MSVFADPTILELIREKTIPVAANDWYQRRRDDAEGEFFRAVASQGPRKGKGGSTRQGHYMLTADGTLLGYNNNRSVERRLQFIRDAFQAWNKIPRHKRGPGAVTVPELADDALDPKYTPRAPENAVVVNVHTRALDRAKGGGFHRARSAPDASGRGLQASFDNLWILESEWQSLVRAAASSKEGANFPAPLALRILRFHLVDNTRGEPSAWRRSEVKNYSMTLRQTANDTFAITGEARLATADASRGYTVNLMGVLGVEGGTLVRFDLVAIGDHWGSGRYTGKPRPGKTPLGASFTIAKGDGPENSIPPQAASWLDGYLRPDRH